METLSFAFGVLTVVGVALATAVVVGIVKVFKMQNKIENMQSCIIDNHNIVLQRISSDNQDVHQRIGYEVDALNRVIVDDRRELNDRIDHLNSYVDSRFDKMENKFIGTGAKKQIING